MKAKSSSNLAIIPGNTQELESERPAEDHDWAREHRLRAKAELERDRLHMAQSAATAIWEWNSDDHSSRLSVELHRMFGTNPEDPDYVEKWLSRVFPEDLNYVQAAIKEGSNSGNLDFEYRYLSPDGGLRWLHCRGARLSADSSDRRMFGVVMDTTERKLAEQAKLQLAAVVECSDDAIISKNLDGIITSWNVAATRMFGYSSDEMIGQSILLLVPPELQEEELAILSRLRAGIRIEHFETERVKKGGERLQVSLTISPIKDGTGRIIGASKIARDITERKRTEEAFRMTERLASVGRLAATVAHEINNPLEAAVNLVYLANHCAADLQQARQYLKMAEEELQRVSQLTKQTLGFYREQSGVVRTRVDEILRQLIGVFSPKAKNKRIQVQLKVKGEPEISTVPSELRQLMANLLSNSIDAVNAGGQIRARVSAYGRNEAGSSSVRITIADNGIGIKPSDLPRVFEPFFTTKRDVGTGLGLWVCKEIAEKHQGRIRIRSNATPGQSWTCVSVFLRGLASKQANDSVRVRQSD